MSKSFHSALLAQIENRKASVCIIGLGYVGLPLAMATCHAGYHVFGFDIDQTKVAELTQGKSYIAAVSDQTLKQHLDAGLFEATTDEEKFSKSQIIIICVPTPLDKHREPDLSYVRTTAEAIGRNLKAGTLIVLESTTYPGTTDEILIPILEKSGLKNRLDFFVGFSPEREDPGNAAYSTFTIPKVVAGDGPEASELAVGFYASVVKQVVPVSTPATAEAVKITENVFRAVNIALVNELKVIYDAMGIDVWEVIDAAKTKPFGYQAFYPGPGLGGHCIPIDPFYLTWKARAFDVDTRFIELAGQINTAMPRHVVNKLEEALSTHQHKALVEAKILILGLAYKKNVPDTRESPTLKLMELLEKRGATCAYHDPHVPEIPLTRERPEYAGRRSVALTPDTLRDFDVVLISTDHDAVDYELIGKTARLIVDTRNSMAAVSHPRAIVIKA